MIVRSVGSLAALGGLAVLLSGCSGASQAPQATTQAPGAQPSAASPAASGAELARQTASAKPAVGLHDGQEIAVTAAGFSPGQPVVAIQCADKGTGTDPGDCDLEHMLTTQTDAAGRVVVKVKVRKGPFGANRILCGTTQKCLVSVAQAAQPPQEAAVAPLLFN